MKNTKLRRRLLIAVFLVAVFVVGILSGQFFLNRSYSSQPYGYNAKATYKEGSYNGSTYDYAAAESYWDDSADYDMAFEEEAYYDTGSTSARAAGFTSEPESPDAEVEEGTVNTQKLVYTGNVSIETTDFEFTLTRIKEAISQAGGFVEFESESDRDNGWYREDYVKSSSTLRANLTARIPSSKFYSFMDGMEDEHSKVTNRSVNVENITRRYSETATYIESYQIQERRLLEMMETTKKVSDMLEIEDRLTEVQTYLRQYQNSLSSMDTDVAYSTVSINLTEVGFYSKPEATTFAEKVKAAFENGIADFIYTVQSLAIWFVEHFLNLLLFILVLFIVVRIIRRIIRKLAKKATPAEPKTEEDRNQQTSNQ